jgi:hypothetical protein
MSLYFDYLYIFTTLGFTVYGQLILKWRISQFELPSEELTYMIRVFSGV